MKHNSKQILDIIAGQGKERNATKAYKEVHPTASDNTARNNVSQLLKKPEAQIYLQEHINKASKKIVQLVDSKKEEIALRASESILNRELGTPRQVTENRSTSLNITIDLKGMNTE